jgi:hypothetical protein
VTGGPAGFGAATPRVLAIAVAAEMKRAKNEHRRMVWTAWHTAALGRVDKMPALDSMMGNASPSPPRPQAWQDQLASVAAWVATMPE